MMRKCQANIIINTNKKPKISYNWYYFTSSLLFNLYRFSSVKDQPKFPFDICSYYKSLLMNVSLKLFKCNPIMMKVATESEQKFIEKFAFIFGMGRFIDNFPHYRSFQQLHHFILSWQCWIDLQMSTTAFCLLVSYWKLHQMRSKKWKR